MWAAIARGHFWAAKVRRHFWTAKGRRYFWTALHHFRTIHYKILDSNSAAPNQFQSSEMFRTSPEILFRTPNPSCPPQMFGTQGSRISIGVVSERCEERRNLSYISMYKNLCIFSYNSRGFNKAKQIM